MDLFGRRKKREEEEKLEQIREQQIERNRIKKEDEEKRWKELEIQYGVSREELRYQLFDDMYTYWRPSDGKQKLTAGHIGVIGWVKRNTHEPEKSEYVEEEFQFKWIDLNMLLDSKPNKNILTCGESGAGKSTLNRFLLQHISDDGSNRIIFMFKPADHYLKAGYPVADMSILAPNPFLDPDSFVSAFAIAFPISMIGITASQIPSLVRDLVLAVLLGTILTVNSHQR